MRRGFVFATVVVMAVFGAASARSSIEWHAVLSSVPSAECVRSAVAHSNGLSLAEYTQDNGPSIFAIGVHRDHYYILIADLNMLVRRNDMGLHIDSGRHRTVRLSLNYGYSPKYEAITDAAAKGLFEAMAVSCAMPDLVQRVKKVHRTSWDPNFLPAF